MRQPSVRWGGGIQKSMGIRLDPAVKPRGDRVRRWGPLTRVWH